jgi:GDP-D-mannose 3',5'-epimerase
VLKDDPIVICGAGGFIGGWLVRSLIEAGHSRVRAVDIKPLSDWFQIFPEAENLSLDLRRLNDCRTAVAGQRYVFNLAADMGGMGFIELNKALCMLSVLINTHLLEASREFSVEKFFFASSACVYNAEKQLSAQVTPLRESDAYPAIPEDGYGWEKLFSERMVRHFDEDFGISGRVARYHNVYGHLGTFDGGREKAPAALARKVATAKLNGHHEIEIWGDGEQTRSFTYISDAVEGTFKLFNSEVSNPLNIGSEEMVSINEMVTILEEIADVSLKRAYRLDAPTGVRGRNSDNSLIRDLLEWSPSVPLHEGLEATYSWIYDQLNK